MFSTCRLRGRLSLSHDRAYAHQWETAYDPSEGADLMTETDALSSNAGLTRVVIVDDDPIVRAHFRDIVSTQSSMVVTGEADCLATAIHLIDREPRLFLLDLGLPDGSGLDLIPIIRARSNARVLIVTSFGDRETVVQALQAGADGYLLKDSDAGVILAGIEATMAGGAPISPAAAVYLLETLRAPATSVGDAAKESSILTPREQQLLKLFAKGTSYKEAARILDISPLTVGNFVKSIYRKLAVNSRGEAVYQAVTAGHIKL